MRQFLEKTLIIVACLYTSYLPNRSTDLVFFFLFALSLSLLLDLFQENKYRYIIYMLFFLVSIHKRLGLAYLPLILYNGYLDFNLYILIALPLLFAGLSPFSLILSLIAIYLSYSTNEYKVLLEVNKSTRDSLIEDTLYLKKYNDQLKIDKEKNIHIAILTERNRIARELHDSIGHSISSSILQVEALKFLCQGEDTKENLDNLQDTLKNGMEDIRKSIHNLYKESLDLENKIYELVKDIPELELKLNYGVSSVLAYELKFDILSIAREAVTNCVKHSNASQIEVSLLEQPKFYSLSIRDNGSLFNYNDSLDTKGIGLSSMEDLAHKYKGFLNFNFDQGFKIHIIFMKG